MNKNGIESCPFCGGNDAALKQADFPAEVGVSGWSVECPDCQASGPHGDYKGAKGQWNCWRSEHEAEIARGIANVTAGLK